MNGVIRYDLFCQLRAKIRGSKHHLLVPDVPVMEITFRSDDYYISKNLYALARLWR